MCILFGREDEAEVDILAPAEITLVRGRVFRQELIGLLGGGVVRLAGVLRECGGREPLHCGVDRCGGRNGFSADC